MRNIKVFIASSNDETEEREALKSLLLKISEVTQKYDVAIVPEMWEMKSVQFSQGLLPKQNEYNAALLSSDMVFFLFGKRVGKYTYEEFQTAYRQLERTASPQKVYVYFKKVELGRIDYLDQQDVQNFGNIFELRNFISKSLNQVYGEYQDISELQQIFVQEVLSAVLPLLCGIPKIEANIQRFIELYNETNKPFQIDKRNSIIEDAINSLFFLSKYNYTPKLDQESFYELCHRILSSAHVGANIRALSFMLKCEWDGSEAEQTFWKDNQAAVRRRVRLERIFIVNKNEAHRLKAIPQVKNHIDLEKQSEYIHSYVVEKEVLQRDHFRLLEAAGNGFIMIDSPQDKIALLDEIPGSEQRAKPVINDQQLSELEMTFLKIKELSVSLEEYLNNISWAHYKKEMISIFLTTKCNLNCDYCFTNKNQDEHRGQTISFEFVKRGIDDYFATDYMRHVRFFGAGEPTVEFELLKKIHGYAKERAGEAVTFEIQTNGAFSDSIAQWLKEHIDIIWISCDGTPDMQDAHRPFLHDKRKTSAVIEKNIRILQSTNSRAFVGMRATITPENVNRQEEMIQYFYGLGIRSIWVDPLFPSVGNQKAVNQNNFDSIFFAKEFIKAAEFAHERGVFYGSILTCNFNDTVNRHCRACLPVPHLTTDGYVSACDMALFGKDKNHMSPLIYGKWDEESKEICYNQQKIEQLRSRTTENMKHCEMCPAKEHCGGYCLGEVLNETGDLFGCKKSACQAICYLNQHLDPKLRKYKYTHP